ncbi:transporter [Vibrio mediterranei AK1]|uniref:vWA domain-containing protein n=1 Tax=Vibrio mediterranei TaxID=689 RepID=UPI0001540884|nr:VWA domain-containing protein [Vibrio mediterranei]EDL54512.1 transporter [Vibrio mediterranei AK1]
MNSLVVEQIISQFHFMRPYWLLAFVPLALLLLLRWRRESSAAWKTIIPEHLQKALVIGEQGWKSQLPLKLLSAILSLAIIVCAGPTWQRESSPFGEDQGELVIVLDTSQSMMQSDLPPSRLERAKYKIRDLLQARQGGKTSLIVFAGSAHTAMPMTEDNQVFLPFLNAISPEVIPVQGKSAQAAIPQIQSQLKGSSSGSVLIISDGVASEAIEQYKKAFEDSNVLVMVMAVGSERNQSSAATDWDSLKQLANDTGGRYYALSIDNTDVEQIATDVERHMQISGESAMPWRDMGYYLVFPIMLLALLWFRKGWLVQWMFIATLLSPNILVSEAHAETVSSVAKTETTAQSVSQVDQLWISAKQAWMNLWLTPEQQGQWYFERGEFLKAAKHYQEPLNKGIAYYYGRDFKSAQAQFLQVQNNELGTLYLGNALARQREYLAARNLYRALAKDTQSADIAEKATHNYQVMQSLVDEINRFSESQKGTTDGPEESIELGDNPQTADGADETTTSEMMLKETLNAREILGSEELADKWLSRVEADPKNFLRNKFQIQLRDTQRGQTQ